MGQPTLCCLATICVALLLTSKASGRGPRNDSLLYHHLFDNYDVELRPVAETTDILMVEMGVALTHIIDMNEKHQTLTASLWLTMGWNDTHLQWNPEEFGNFKRITVPSKKVWMPDIVLYQNVDPYFDGWSHRETYVKIHSNGYILWEVPAVIVSSCHLDVSNFPFDTQACQLKFGPWIHSGFELVMRAMAEDGSLEGFIEHPEWTVLYFKATANMIWYGEDFNIGTPYADVTFTLGLQRKSTFYVFNLLLPCLLLTFIMAVTFFLPINSGERLSFGVSLLLSMVVFQLVITEVLPESDKLPWIGRYVIITMILMSFSLAMTIFVMHVCDCTVSVEPLPKWVREVMLKRLAKVLLMGDLSKNLRTLDPDESSSKIELVNDISDITDTLYANNSRVHCGLQKDVKLVDCYAFQIKMTNTLHDIERKVNDVLDIMRHHQRHRAYEKEWRSLAKVLDRVFLIMYILVAGACLVSFASNTSSKPG
ncbi:CHRNA9 [Branchiostoma lanceolatum]|uniref:CHRNA9 protein n=1 Tax=Branchiostoma lanceolatum TaxID=7740 RepID=A0A8K0ACB5_BRALA|nr:CHRNA9 [Branchiostoma lanceolatum]